MKLELNLNYASIVKMVMGFLGKNKVILTSIVLLLLGVVVIQRINELTVADPDQSHKNKRLSELTKVNFDQESIDAITKLNSSSIEITSDFTNRTNPFADN